MAYNSAQVAIKPKIGSAMSAAKLEDMNRTSESMYTQQYMQRQDSFNVTHGSAMSGRSHSLASQQPYQNLQNSPPRSEVASLTSESAFASIMNKQAPSVLIPKPHVTRRANQKIEEAPGKWREQQDTIFEVDES